MENEKAFNARIARITAIIQDRYPELTKYLDEMTTTIPYQKHPEISTLALKNYYDSLDSLVRNYAKETCNKNITIEIIHDN